MIQLVAAIDLNRTIGKNNSLPWPRHKEDMQRFRKITTGGAVLMGRKTFESMGSKPLPNRYNYVLSRDPTWDTPDGLAAPIRSTEEAIRFLKEYPGNIFVIGGAEVYRTLRDHVQRAHVTVFKARFEGDVHFPEGTLDGFEIESIEEFDTVSETNPIAHRYVVYSRRKAK